jgi:hypothetical protein
MHTHKVNSKKLDTKFIWNTIGILYSKYTYIEVHICIFLPEILCSVELNIVIISVLWDNEVISLNIFLFFSPNF